MASGADRILVVDDDTALLNLMDIYLSRLGYRVDVCRRAAEAWALVEASPSGYAGVLVDLNMPDMRGEELARRIMKCNASIRLVVMSGQPGVVETLDGSRVGFLHKPFAPKELADALAGGR